MLVSLQSAWYLFSC